jgi:hypothetical protein
MMERISSRVVALVALVFLGGCVALGWRFGPGYSCASEDMFAQPPVVVHRGDERFLAWTQGEYPFFFEPSYHVMDGRLVFAMVATSSSGNLAGRYREMRIEDADNLEALERGGAFWWEPDESFVRLKVVESQTRRGDEAQ